MPIITRTSGMRSNHVFFSDGEVSDGEMGCGTEFSWRSSSVSIISGSSDFFLTNLKNGNKALCVGKNALVVWTATGVGMGMTNGCADVAETPKVAVVTVESPAFLTIGCGLLLLGFLLQVFSIEKPKPDNPVHVSYGPRQKSPKK